MIIITDTLSETQSTSVATVFLCGWGELGYISWTSPWLPHNTIKDCESEGM